MTENRNGFVREHLPGRQEHPFRRKSAQTSSNDRAGAAAAGAFVAGALYTIRSERQLMEQLHYNLLYCWFVGLGVDDPV